MGILQPPPPKVKMSNLMRVLGDEAIADPSTVERKVRQQVEQRRKEHEQRNEARRLPAEERKQKKKQKWMAENEPTTQVLVFKIKDLANKRHLFKIDMNAQQFHLTGICIACSGVANIVIVEGGPRAIKRYKKLMTRRIKWTEDQKDDDDDEDDDEGWGMVRTPWLPPPPSQPDEVEQWARAMFTDPNASSSSAVLTGVVVGSPPVGSGMMSIERIRSMFGKS